MALGTWLPDPEANNQLQKAYASTAGLDMSDSDRRNAAHKLVGNSKFTKQSKRSKYFGKSVKSTWLLLSK